MRRARRSKPLTARRHFAASCSARERATSTDASVLEAPCLCYHGSLAEKQRRSWDARRTWPAAVAVALGFASPVMGAAVRWPSRMMSAATRPGAPASGARGRRGGEKHGAWMSDAPASGGRSPSQPPDQRLQARQPGAAEASASAGRGAAAAPWSQRGAVRPGGALAQNCPNSQLWGLKHTDGIRQWVNPTTPRILVNSNFLGAAAVGRVRYLRPATTWRKCRYLSPPPKSPSGLYACICIA